MQLGAYLIDVLEAHERTAMSRHLQTCRTCQSDYDDLVPVIELLRIVDADALTGATPDGTGRRRPAHLKLGAAR
ncbi:MAG: hypothetical protein ACRDU8_05740 [Egibacteraceae bacterium]